MWWRKCVISVSKARGSRRRGKISKKLTPCIRGRCPRQLYLYHGTRAPKHTGFGKSAYSTRRPLRYSMSDIVASHRARGWQRQVSIEGKKRQSQGPSSSAGGCNTQASALVVMPSTSIKSLFGNGTLCSTNHTSCGMHAHNIGYLDIDGEKSS